MSPIVSAKVEIDHPKVKATGADASGRARSSIEVKDSCNCCRFCFPCFGKKAAKKDPRKESDTRSLEIMRRAQESQMDIYSSVSRTIVRSPASENLASIPAVAACIPCDNHPSTASPLSELSADPLTDSQSTIVDV